MLILESTGSLTVVLSTSVTTDQLRCVASYRDINTTDYNPKMAAAVTNNTTAITIVAAPASGNVRVVDFLSIYNHDTTAKTVTVNQVVSGTDYILMKVTLAPGERLEYTDGAGFRITTTDGAVKTSVNQGANSPITGYTRATLGADVTNNNGSANTIADVTGLSAPVTNGQRMWFRFVIQYTAAATTTGSRWSVNGPTFSELRYRSEYSLTTTSRTTNDGLIAYDNPSASNASSAATGGNVAVIEGIIVPTANGSVIARFASEISSSAIVAKAGSFVDYAPV